MSLIFYVMCKQTDH